MNARIQLVPTEKGSAPVMVLLEHGPFAVHQTSARCEVRGQHVYCAGADFTLTHVPSGFAVCSAFGHPADALNAAEAIELLADWNFTDPKTVKAWPPELRAQVCDAVNAHLSEFAEHLKATP